MVQLGSKWDLRLHDVFRFVLAAFLEEAKNRDYKMPVHKWNLGIFEAMMSIVVEKRETIATIPMPFL